MGVKFPGKKRYVTLEWPLKQNVCPILNEGMTQLIHLYIVLYRISTNILRSRTMCTWRESTCVFQALNHFQPVLILTCFPCLTSSLLSPVSQTDSNAHLESVSRLGFEVAYLTTHDKVDFYGHVGYAFCPPVVSLGSASSLLSDKMVRHTAKIHWPVSRTLLRMESRPTHH